MSECGSCGTRIQAGQNFCPQCGATLLSPVIAAMIRDAQQALASHPEDGAARYNLALAYKLAGLEEMALSELAQVVQLQPDFADVHYELGALYARQGRIAEAAASLRRAQELDPEDERAGRLLGRLDEAG